MGHVIVLFFFKRYKLGDKIEQPLGTLANIQEDPPIKTNNQLPTRDPFALLKNQQIASDSRQRVYCEYQQQLGTKVKKFQCLHATAAAAGDNLQVRVVVHLHAGGFFRCVGGAVFSSLLHYTYRYIVHCPCLHTGHILASKICKYNPNWTQVNGIQF